MALRNSNQMDMIIHQTICPDINPLLPAVIFKKIKIQLFVIPTEKYLLTAIASLDDMMRAVRNDNSGKSRHI